MSWNYFASMFVGGRNKTGQPYSGLFGSAGKFKLGVTTNTVGSLMDAINQYSAGMITADQLQHMSNAYLGQADGYKLTKALLKVRRNTIEYERTTTKIDQMDKWIHKFGSTRAAIAKSGIDLTDTSPGAAPLVIATALVGGQVEQEKATDLAYNLRLFNEVTMPKHAAKMRQIGLETQAKLYRLEAKEAETQAWIGAVGSISSSLASAGGGLKIR